MRHPHPRSIIEAVAMVIFLAAVYLFIQYMTVVYFASWYSDSGQFEWADGWERFLCIYRECENGVVD